MTAEDKAFVATHLNDKEQALFYAMAVFDERHALNVARTAQKLAEGLTLDQELLLRVSLLHDIGRTKVSLWDKVFAVVMDKLFPTLTKRLARKNHALHIYYHHPKIGADKLRSMGLAREAEIIAKHHDLSEAGDLPELAILRRADEQN